MIRFTISITPRAFFGQNYSRTPHTSTQRCAPCSAPLRCNAWSQEQYLQIPGISTLRKLPLDSQAEVPELRGCGRCPSHRCEPRCDEEVAKAPTLAQPEHPAARNQRLSDKRMGGGQHAGAKNVAQSSAHRQQTALLHASRQRADELRKASSQRAAGAAASRRQTRLAPWRCSRSWGVPAATPLLRRRRRTFSLSGASAIMLTSWCYSA